MIYKLLRARAVELETISEAGLGRRGYGLK